MFSIHGPTSFISFWDMPKEEAVVLNTTLFPAYGLTQFSTNPERAVNATTAKQKELRFSFCAIFKRTSMKRRPSAKEVIMLASCYLTILPPMGIHDNFRLF